MYGQIVRAKHKETKLYFAVKIIPKNKVKCKERFIKEVNVLQELVTQSSLWLDAP
jgi:serine/threonine protein kinase